MSDITIKLGRAYMPDNGGRLEGYLLELPDGDKLFSESVTALTHPASEYLGEFKAYWDINPPEFVLEKPKSTSIQKRPVLVHSLPQNELSNHDITMFYMGLVTRFSEYKKSIDEDIFGNHHPY